MFENYFYIQIQVPSISARVMALHMNKQTCPHYVPVLAYPYYIYQPQHSKPKTTELTQKLKL
jgi:hypothetical protein